MKNFFKKLFSFFFQKKKPEIIIPIEPVITEEKHAIKIPVQEIKERIDNSFMPPVPKKWRMKNNRLHIVYNGTSRFAGSNGWVERIGKRFRFHKADKMYNGCVESMRCTKLHRAQEIIGGIERYCIDKAFFQDKDGNQIQIA